MTRFFKSLGDAMTAAAFAEAGEHGMAREYLAATDGGRRKKVVLGVPSLEISPALLRHVLHLCGRVGASLEVVHASRDGGAGKKGETASLPGMTGGGEVSHYVAENGMSLGEALRRYLAGRRNIIFVVLGGNFTGNPTELARCLGCPVVRHEGA